MRFVTRDALSALLFALETTAVAMIALPLSVLLSMRPPDRAPCPAFQCSQVLSPHVGDGSWKYFRKIVRVRERARVSAECIALGRDPIRAIGARVALIRESPCAADAGIKPTGESVDVTDGRVEPTGESVDVTDGRVEPTGESVNVTDGRVKP